MTNEYSTPFKSPTPVLTGGGSDHDAFDRLLVDSPFVFLHRGDYRMMYVGFDGIGHQTALARSDDLVNWSFDSVILKRRGGHGWDDLNVSGTWILRDNALHGHPRLKKWQGRYWLPCHAYPSSARQCAAISANWTYWLS